jgi:hypothetical protein
LQAAPDHLHPELVCLVGEDVVGIVLVFAAGADGLCGKRILIEAESLLHVGVRV